MKHQKLLDALVVYRPPPRLSRMSMRIAPQRGNAYGLPSDPLHTRPRRYLVRKMPTSTNGTSGLTDRSWPPRDRCAH